MSAWTELAMICIVITCTVFWVSLFCDVWINGQSIDVGIYVGIGLSLLLVIKAAGNYNLRPLKIDHDGDGFVATDHPHYRVTIPRPPQLRLI